MNSSWGHSQFTSSHLTCSSVLLSWSAVGNVSTTFRLLAAAVKTAKVARQLCFTQGISDTGHYLADAYIENIVELLWKCWNEACTCFLLSSLGNLTIVISALIPCPLMALVMWQSHMMI